MRDVAPDTIIDERYRVQQRVGSGGMADVYCVEDLQLGRKVALKMLYRRFAADSEFVERFRREASSAAGLQHPNVVAVYDRGEWDGTYYIAMEYLDGSSLKDIVRRDGALDPEFAIDVTVQTLKAVRFAHKRGIIHRDLKPHNVILDSEGRAKVTDFGIARAGASDMTETGSIMGTAQYLSPEQAQGHAVSAQSDIYSVGVMLYELLTGRVPFDAESAVTIALKQVSEAPVPPSVVNPDVWPGLEEVVLKALQKDPADRFHDAEQFIDALELVRGGGSAGLVLPVGGNGTTTASSTGTGSGTLNAAALAAYAGAHGTVGGTTSGSLDVLVADGATPPPGTGSFVLYGPEPPPKPRSWLKTFLIVGMSVAIFALVVGGYLLLRPERVAVPNTVGRDGPTASALLSNAGFQPNIESVQNTSTKGRVFRQEPQPGVRLKEGATVTIYVSTGPGTTPVPTVEGLRQRAAERAMQQAGFKTKVRMLQSEDVEEGLVLGTDPPAGQQLEVGQTVTIEISAGPRPVKVPGVVGRSLDQAERTLIDAGLEVDIRESVTDDRDPNTVISSDPAAGTEVDRGSTVTLTIAKAPKKEDASEDDDEISVPGTRGEEAAAAAKELRDAGFVVDRETVEVELSSQDGKVQRQSPSGGSKLKKGQTVTIFVGRFEPPDPEPTPSASPTPTPTESPTPTPTP